MGRKRIGEILVEMGTLTSPEVDRILTALARREPGVKFGQLGKKMGLVDDEQILAALAVQMELVPREWQRDLRPCPG